MKVIILLWGVLMVFSPSPVTDHVFMSRDRGTYIRSEDWTTAPRVMVCAPNTRDLTFLFSSSPNTRDLTFIFSSTSCPDIGSTKD